MPRKRKVIDHRDFVRDLGRGAHGEDIVDLFFQEEFGVEVRNVTKQKVGWDFEVDKWTKKELDKTKAARRKKLNKFKKVFGNFKTPLSVEVKFDEAAARYKNIFIELLFDVKKGAAGAVMNCKADVFVWVIPDGRKKYKILLLKRPEFLAWLMGYVLEKDDIKIKTPSVSPYARGLAIPVKEIEESFSCLGVYEFTL